MTSGMRSSEVVVVRRHIRAKPDRVFAAWTEPEQLVRWWGPPGTECTEAYIDLRVGGQFRLANKLPDGNVVWISGTYEEVESPRRLRHTWLVEAMPGAVASTVSITFDANNGGTDVVISHENIANAELRDSHESGWIGCLDCLATLLAEPA